MKLLSFNLYFLILVALIACDQDKKAPVSYKINEHIISEKPSDTLITDSGDTLEYYDTTGDTAYYEEDYMEEYPLLDSALTGLNFKATGSYSNLKSVILTKRQTIREKYLSLTDSVEKQKFIDSIGFYITKVLLNDIFPHWYGTEWDFNGITEIPRKGYVACGYFVSTTLRDIGLNMNRYKFAQQTGLNGAKTLQMGEEIRKFYSSNTDDIPRKLVEELKSGLYQVGLSCHVGYLLIRNREAWFIHSNYIHSGVMVEKAADSEAFESNVYVISDITYNRNLIKKWILSEKITIIRD